MSSNPLMDKRWAWDRDHPGEPLPPELQYQQGEGTNEGLKPRPFATATELTAEAEAALIAGFDRPVVAEGLTLDPSAIEEPADLEHKPPVIPMPALPYMRQAADTYEARRSTYGPSEQKFADVMLALFPNGVTLTTQRDFVRWGLFSMIISKATRYANKFTEPHADSIHDLGVYAFMLEAEDLTPPLPF